MSCEKVTADVILFTAPWCNNCKSAKQVVEDRELYEVKVVNIDASEGEELMKKHNVRGLPTLVVGRNVHMGDAAVIEALNLLAE